jgi:hypothetical protein
MDNYIITIIAMLIVTNIIIFVFYRIKNTNKEQTTGGMLIATGVALITSSFPSLSGSIIELLNNLLINSNLTSSNSVNFVSLICGFSLIIIGLYYNKNIKDRLFVLNMLSKDKKLISDKKREKDLHISDYKLREHQIDVIRMFNDAENLSQTSCKYITEEIEEKINNFVNQSKDFKKIFTGMFSIPFTILAGTYLSATEIDEYYEYNRNNDKYYYILSKKWNKKKKNYPILNVIKQEPNPQETEVIIAISVTKNVMDTDLVQFSGKDTIKLELQKTDDNVIKFREQLDEYTKLIIKTLEDLKLTYPNLKKVHLVGAIPSCLSIELGRRISLNRNRLPQIISYHFKYGNTPKYSFGLIVTEVEKGKIIKQ